MHFEAISKLEVLAEQKMYYDVYEKLVHWSEAI